MRQTCFLNNKTGFVARNLKQTPYNGRNLKVAVTLRGYTAAEVIYRTESNF